MAHDPQIELRVSRLENDRDSIYDLLSEITSTQQAHSRRFDAVDQRFDGIDQRFDSIEKTLAEVVRRLPEPA